MERCALVKALHFFHKRGLSKNSRSQWAGGKSTIQQRLQHFFLRDLLPSVIILIILGLVTSFVAEWIYQAKGSHDVNMAEKGSLRAPDKDSTDRMLPIENQMNWPRTEKPN